MTHWPRKCNTSNTWPTVTAFQLQTWILSCRLGTNEERTSVGQTPGRFMQYSLATEYTSTHASWCSASYNVISAQNVAASTPPYLAVRLKLLPTPSPHFYFNGYLPDKHGLARVPLVFFCHVHTKNILQLSHSVSKDLTTFIRQNLTWKNSCFTNSILKLQTLLTTSGSINNPQRFCSSCFGDMVTLTLTTRQRFHLDVRLLQDTNRKSHIVSQMQLTIGVLFWWPEVRQVLLYTYRLWHPAMQLLHYRHSGLVNTQAIPKVNNLEHRLQWLQ